MGQLLPASHHLLTWDHCCLIVPSLSEAQNLDFQKLNKTQVCRVCSLRFRIWRESFLTSLAFGIFSVTRHNIQKKHLWFLAPALITDPHIKRSPCCPDSTARSPENSQHHSKAAQREGMHHPLQPILWMRTARPGEGRAAVSGFFPLQEFKQTHVSFQLTTLALQHLTLPGQ